MFEKLFKSLRDPKDHNLFCKLLHIYFIGIVPLKDFVTLYEIKFQPKLRQEIKDEVEKNPLDPFLVPQSQDSVERDTN